MHTLRLPIRRTLIKNVLAALALALVLAGVPAAMPASAQPADCFFTAGFKALRDQIPEVVGQCLENEAFNVENGNAEQRTTGGLLVWRKVDNWTAFTDGSTTWLNGPAGLQSRPNAGPLFSWESAAPPVAAPAPAPAQPPAPAPAPAPAPQQASGPIQIEPVQALLGLGDVGKDIIQVYLKQGEDGQSKWAESRFSREIELAGKRLGPNKIVSRVYIAKNIDAAKDMYQSEVNNNKKRFPEEEDQFGTTYVNDGKDPKNTVVNRGDEQDSRAACNESCNTINFNRLHQRTVFRYKNAVAVIYFWGENEDATTIQMDEWLGKVRERLG